MTPKPQELPKLYSMFSIGLVTFFCSLLAGGYLLYANYKALGMRKMARYVLAATIALFAVFLWALSAYIEGASNTAEELPQLPITINLVAAVAQAIVAVMATQVLQGPMFATFKEMRGNYHSTWQALFIGLCAAFLISMFMALIAALTRL
ncbi:MAG TPA: hypothetical protein DDZ32_01065 [Gammaproteobacteria bacterium]|mgnify:FL=1|jgi:hypothetical protein|nr:hypothetical protein [Gammaproteobacteria bacterium]|tara:strand:+ start:2035 stop:2484 length:450 start_codon:yes stop_codon:yes gene_type:complete